MQETLSAGNPTATQLFFPPVLVRHDLVKLCNAGYLCYPVKMIKPGLKGRVHSRADLAK